MLVDRDAAWRETKRYQSKLHHARLRLDASIKDPRGKIGDWRAARSRPDSGHEAPRGPMDRRNHRSPGNRRRLPRSPALLILDDWAITPMIAEQRRDLLEIVEDRCGRASTLIASNIPFADWHNAIVDRLIHNAYRTELKGDSMRKNNAKIRQQT